MNAQLKSHPQKILSFALLASLMVGIFPVAPVRAELCAEPLGLVKKNLLSNLNLLGGLAPELQVSQLKISDLIEVPADNFFASFFMEAPTVDTPSWGYEISITDPFDKHPHAISWVTRERYMLEYSPGKTWTLARCTTHSLANCQPELVEPNVLEALTHCP